MAKKISKKKIDGLIEFVSPYYIEHTDKLIALAERMDDVMVEEGLPAYIASIGMIATAMIYGYVYDEELYDTFMEGLYNEDYEKCIEVCEYLHEHAYYALTVTWDSYPKLLSRHFLISARCNIADMMYAIMVAFRCEGYHIIETKHGADFYQPAYLIMNNDFAQDIDPAEFVPIAALAEDGKATVTYDFGDNWCFNVRFRKPVIIKDNPTSPNVILQKATGYGIFEDNRYLLETFIQNPLEEYEGVMVKDILPFDFSDAMTDELKEGFEPLFKYMRNAYNTPEDYNAIEPTEEGMVS